MKPLEHLLAEELPTGTFGDRPDPEPPQPKARRPLGQVDPLAAQHRADLLADLKTYDAGQRSGRHLRAVA